MFEESQRWQILHSRSAADTQEGANKAKQIALGRGALASADMVTSSFVCFWFLLTLRHLHRQYYFSAFIPLEYVAASTPSTSSATEVLSCFYLGLLGVFCICLWVVGLKSTWRRVWAGLASVVATHAV